MSIKKRSLIILMSLVCTSSHAQTLQEWAQTVHWDGVSHWSKYIITLPAHMGPNALPVPFIGNGSVDSTVSVSASAQFHFRNGDHTQNLAIYGNYCLVKDLVSFDIAYVPVEFFNMSDALKKERHVYYTHYYKKAAKGDVYLNGTVRLMKKWDKHIQLALRFGFRLPSSNMLEAARFTDNMGYYSDISFGKPLSSHLKLIGMAGLYVWQLTGDGHRQDDAFLFGAGLEWNNKGWRVQGYGAGYLGYQHGSGDKPVVLRAGIEKRYKRAGWLLRFQQGVNDFKYTTAEAGMKWIITAKK